jgi:uncharacterized coiled-coil protein SlyX
MIRRIILRHLAFEGKTVEPAILQLEDGVNVVYGASNTGKSFAAVALDFMLGAGDPLPRDVEQLAGYENALLGMTVPEMGDITLARAISGGHFELFKGLYFAKPADVEPRKLAAKHNKNNRENNLSAVLLGLLGFQAREVVTKTTTGAKESFTFRSVAPFVIVKESAMLSDYGPAFSNDEKEPVEKSIFKAFLTGVDDAAVVPMVDPKISKALVAGKVEFVEEIVARINENLGSDVPSIEQLQDQLGKLTQELGGLEGRMQERQTEVDQLATERRSALDRIASSSRDIGELQLTVDRFTELNQVYETDLKRLAAIEEGGVVLLAMAGRPCPFCGAEPEHQHHDHGVAEAQATYDAAKLEMAKISRDQTVLLSTTASLKAEIRSKATYREQIQGDLQRMEARLNLARPLETTTRSGYEALSARRKQVSDQIEMQQEKARLLARKDTLLAESKSAPTNLKLDVGPSGPVGHELAQTIQDVLSAWQYPGDVTVSFDLEALDIRLNGKIRTANGKGVRALLHAAFNVGLLIYCRQKGLPHPGFLVLDTPLLTYREPSKNKRHGALSADEQALKDTGVQRKFFEHLNSLRDVQFLILENVDPPSDMALPTTFFSGEIGDDRVGLFPASANKSES